MTDSVCKSYRKYVIEIVMKFQRSNETERRKKSGDEIGREKKKKKKTALLMQASCCGACQIAYMVSCSTIEYCVVVVVTDIRFVSKYCYVQQTREEREKKKNVWLWFCK